MHSVVCTGAVDHGGMTPVGEVTSTATTSAQVTATLPVSISAESSSSFSADPQMLSLANSSSTEQQSTPSAVPSTNTTSADDNEHVAGPSTKKTKLETEFTAPAQESLKKDMEVAKCRLIKLQDLKDCGLATAEICEELIKSKAYVKECESKLVRMVKDAERQKSRRARLKAVLTDLSVDSDKLKKYVRERSGRPQLEDEQVDLHSAIIQLVTYGAGTDKRRRTEILNACLTLDDLASELRKLNFTLSRSALYLRLIPRRANSHEGLKHINTVPVKLRRAENSERKGHENSEFAFATKEYMKSIASVFGPDAVFALSIDDKAKVPIGLAAANKQAPLLMCLEYEVRLPDHDFVIAGGHKLTPSVYAGCVIKSPSEHACMSISYSGPMYIAIRSAKHDGSSAYTHGRDVDELLKLDSFQDIAKCPDGSVKPIFLAFVDGGPDENPRFPKTLSVAVERFKKLNLDVYIAMTHAPGMSAYNYVERRMAPLSRELAGVILPHDSFGTHLNSSGKTIDDQLERSNFRKAGEVLAEIWNTLVLDDYPVNAQYVENHTMTVPDVDECWIARHCRIAQYTLQIVRCCDSDCCGPFRTSWLAVVPNRFLPAPFPWRRSTTGPFVPEPIDVLKSDKFMDLWQRIACTSAMKPQAAIKFKGEIPYDLYCPSLRTLIDRRICRNCDLYLPSVAAVTRHRQQGACRGRILPLNAVEDDRPTDPVTEATDSSDTTADSVRDTPLQPTQETPAVMRNIFDIFQCPWENI